MKPETALFLQKSKECLKKAEEFLEWNRWPEEAGRAAYLAGFHAAQAAIFEWETRVVKTHKGVQSEFGRLAKDDPRFDLESRAFLGRTYNLKAIADYETGPDAHVTKEKAAEAVAAARSFVARLAALLVERAP